MSEDGNQEPYYIIPGLPESSLPYYNIPGLPESGLPESSLPYYNIPGQPAHKPYYNLPDGGRGDLPVYHVFAVPVQAQGAVPVHHIYDTPEHNSRGDDKRVVSSDEGLGRSAGTTTCTCCKQHVTTDVTYRVGRFARMMCVLFVILGLLMCLLPMLLLPLPLCVKSFKDVHHTCPCCRTALHVEQKRCCKGRT